MVAKMYLRVIILLKATKFAMDNISKQQMTVRRQIKVFDKRFCSINLNMKKHVIE